MKLLSNSLNYAKLEIWTIGSLRQNPYLKKFYDLRIQPTLRANGLSQKRTVQFNLQKLFEILGFASQFASQFENVYTFS